MKFNATIVDSFLLITFFSFSSGEKTSEFFKQLEKYSQIARRVQSDVEGRGQDETPISCFSGKTQFLSKAPATQQIVTKPASSLKYGDYVQAYSGGKVSFQKIIGFSKRNVKTNAVFKKLFLQNRSLEITANHLIMVGNVENLVYAESLKIGDRVLTIQPGA